MEEAADRAVRAAEDARAVEPRRQPLTERVLARLGRPRWLWIALWASTAVLTPAFLLSALAAQGELGRVTSLEELFVGQAVISYVILVCLWGVGRLARDTRALEPDLARLTGTPRPLESLTAFGSLAPPILLAVAVEAVNIYGTASRYGALAAIAALPFLTLSIVPIMTFVWTYLQLLVGLDRLGRARLALDLFPQDRSLGLAPVGSLAFTGFVVLWAAVIPIMIGNQGNWTFLLSVAIVVVLVSAFFLSMWRLHRQMSSAKAAYVAEARELFAQAYEPIRRDGTLEALQTQAPLLGPAQALEERAERILEWPLDEGTTARVAIILTGIVTGLLLRFIQLAAHL